jgi:hypothetical protein
MFRWIERSGWLAVVYLCCQVLFWLWVDVLHAPDWEALVGGCFIAAVGVMAAFSGLDCWMDLEASSLESSQIEPMSIDRPAQGHRGK